MKDQNQNWTKTSLVHSKHFLVPKEQPYLKYRYVSPTYKGEKMKSFALTVE